MVSSSPALLPGDATYTGPQEAALSRGLWGRFVGHGARGSPWILIRTMAIQDFERCAAEARLALLDVNPADAQMQWHMR
jgi:hypothetical protein